MLRKKKPRPLVTESTIPRWTRKRRKKPRPLVAEPTTGQRARRRKSPRPLVDEGVPANAAGTGTDEGARARRVVAGISPDGYGPLVRAMVPGERRRLVDALATLLIADHERRLGRAI